MRVGIYTANKTQHADKWRALRGAGDPVISTWIDEAGKAKAATCPTCGADASARLPERLPSSSIARTERF